jgi:hypothetical protein
MFWDGGNPKSFPQNEADDDEWIGLRSFTLERALRDRFLDGRMPAPFPIDVNRALRGHAPDDLQLFRDNRPSTPETEHGLPDDRLREPSFF